MPHVPRLSKNDDIGQLQQVHIVHNCNGGTYLLFECHLFHLRINMQKCKIQTRKQYKSLPLRTLVKVYNFQAVNIQGTPPIRKIDFFLALPKLPTPQFGQVVQLFLTSKTTFLRILQNDDYENDVSDNCDNNFGTFDDFGVKNDQKVSHNMILMSKYKGPHVEKKVKKFG